MNQTLIAAASLCAEVSIVLALIWCACRALDVRARILVQRCAFVVAACAPLTLLAVTPDNPLASAPAAFSVSIASTDASEPAGRLFAWQSWIMSIWLGVAILVLGRAVLAHVVLSNMFARARLPDDDLAHLAASLSARLAPRASVEVRVSDRARAPCTFGFLRCKVLLPASLPASASQAVLTHELCHIRARDSFWLSVSQIAGALNWYNPLVWMLAREHGNDIEAACDDDAINGGVELDDYVRALVAAAGRIARPAGVGAIAMSRSGLTARVRALLNRSSPMTLPSLPKQIMLVGAVAALASLLAAGDLVAAQEMENTAPGHGRIYIRAARGVEVRIGNIAMCANDANCVFEFPLGEEVVLRSSSSRGGELSWSGCAPAGDNSCVARISEDPVRVSARLR